MSLPGGMASSRRATRPDNIIGYYIIYQLQFLKSVIIITMTVPPRAVSMERRTRKLPSLSARNPARGGVKMKRMGMMALITEASCTLMPRY